MVFLVLENVLRRKLSYERITGSSSISRPLTPLRKLPAAWAIVACATEEVAAVILGEGGCDSLLLYNELFRVTLIRASVKPLGWVAEPGSFEVTNVVDEDFGALLKHKLSSDLKHNLRQFPAHAKAETTWLVEKQGVE